MRPTKYNQRITIQQLTRVDNNIGGWSNSWTDLYKSWASVRPIKGFKRLEYGKTEYGELYEVEMRSRRVNADGDCRVIYAGQEYQIIGILPEGDRITLDIAR